MACFIHRQRGQALALALVLAVLGAAGLFHMFRTGQTVAHKTRLLNAADAAAYGAAVWRARVLNFNAYSNRAIIAQEVAVAQALTLQSWSRHFEQFSRNAARMARVYPPLAAVFETLAESASVARELVDATATVEIRLRAAPATGYKELLQASQELLTLSAGVFGASAVANEVARASDREFFAFALPDAGAFNRFTRRYDSDPDRERIRDLVVRSLDDFTSGPREVDMVLWGLPASCVLSLNSPSAWFQMYRKRGGTVLAPGLDRWEAVDTASIHDNRRRGFLGRRCSRVELLPMGWGAAEASLDGPLGRSVAQPGGVAINPTALEFAEAQLDDPFVPSATDETFVAFEADYAGIARVRELAYENLESQRYPRSRVAVLARVDARRLARNPALEEPSGRLRPPGGHADERLWALAAAEAHFVRPPADPQREEYASLYNPYWQARLVAPSPTERLAAESHVD
ncbi:MAG: hypothetical protein WCZ28_16240 [Burkholderiaceae bacterium]